MIGDWTRNAGTLDWPGLKLSSGSQKLAQMTSAIIVAAGQGTRMGPNLDKLFLEVAGRPVIVG